MIKTFGAKDVIFNQGDKADCMYEMINGSVGIYANYGKSNEKLLTTLKAGNTFGEMGMIDNMPRSATAVALDFTTQVKVITADNFADYFQENPGKVLAIMKHMSSRIRGLTQEYLDACRAVTESEEAAQNGKKSSWLKDHIKKFMKDYADATLYMNQNPDIFTGMHGYHDSYYL